MAIDRVKNQNGSVRFKVRVKDPDSQWYETPSFNNEEDARIEEARLFDLKRKGKRAISQDARQVSFHEFWEVWALENRTDVSDGWKISQDQMYRDYVKPVIGSLRMIEIEEPQVGRIFNQMKQMGRGDQLRKHVYSLVRKMFGDAVEYYRMLDRNPVVAKFHRPKVKRKKREFLHPEEVMSLLNHVEGTYLGPPTWIAMLSALRISEIQALKGKALLFPMNQILICAAFNNKTGVSQNYPKQEDWGYSPMAPMLKDYLLGLNVGPEDFVAPGPQGGMLSYETYLRALARECRKAGVKQITPHELRHSSTEIWARAGASTEDLRRLLNHASLSATMGYLHRTPERLTEVGKGLRLILGGESSPKSSPLGNEETYATASIGVKH